MGANVMSRGLAVGGNSDPANSRRIVGGPRGDTYYAMAPYATVPRDNTTPGVWTTLSYKKDTVGAVAPTHTSVIYRRVIDHTEANPVVVNAGLSFDLTGLELGDVVYIVAEGNGLVANPWSLAAQCFVFRGTTGQAVDPVESDPLGTRTPNVWDGGPEFVAYDDFGVLQPAGTGVGITIPAAIVLAAADTFHAVQYLVTNSDITLPTLSSVWVPPGAGVTAARGYAWAPVTVGDDGDWGAPDKTAGGASAILRQYALNVQGTLDPDTLPNAVVNTTAVNPFYMMVAASERILFVMDDFNTDPPFPNLRNIGGRIYPKFNMFGAEIGTKCYGTRDLLATRVRPQFIDQMSEGGGGIFFEH